jgi:hypothetical protein
MKIHFWFFLVIAGLYSGLAGAQSPCAVECDKQWNTCIKQCSSGDNGRECKNSCAEQHEACLNSCNRQPVQSDTLKQRAIPRAPSTSPAR